MVEGEGWKSYFLYKKEELYSARELCIFIRVDDGRCEMRPKLIKKYCTMCPKHKVYGSEWDSDWRLVYCNGVEFPDKLPKEKIVTLIVLEDFVVPEGCPYILELALEGAKACVKK